MEIAENGMKIIDVRTVLLTGPSTNDRFLKEARAVRSAAFVEVVTDTPHTGVGETYAGYFCPELVRPIVDFFRPILIGRNVDNIAALWADMYHCGNFWCRVGLGTAVLNGVEAALWDLKGKLTGLPVYELLGGSATRQAVLATTRKTGWRRRSNTISRSASVRRKSLWELSIPRAAGTCRHGPPKPWISRETNLPFSASVSAKRCS
jgi:L-alanine-DL-glutamate epimerase-like enolase superfamily enzyme